jgi:hypothetical protein
LAGRDSIFKPKRHWGFEMVVGRLALENELSRCEEELRMLGGEFEDKRDGLTGKLQKVNSHLTEIHRKISGTQLNLKSAVWILCNLISHAIKKVLASGYDDVGWTTTTGSLIDLTERVRIIGWAAPTVHRDLGTVCDTIRNALDLIHQDASSCNTERVDFINRLLVELGDGLLSLETEACNNFYDFLGPESKAEMLLLIDVLKN